MTKEFRLKVNVKNNLILSKIEALGFENVNQFCATYSIPPSQVGEILNFKVVPFKKNGEWKELILKLSDIFGCDPEDIISEEQRNLKMDKNNKTAELSYDEIATSLHPSLLEVPSESMVLKLEDCRIINEVLDTLTPREKKVIELRFGLNGEAETTLKEIGKELSVGGQRIRDIEAKAIRKMRHPCRSDIFEEAGMLNDYVEG